MRRFLRRRPSPAMVVAIIGVVAATSGDAVGDGVKAVASVVGKDQVTSRSVKNNSLLLADFKKSERAKLRGAKGRPGVAGPAGPVGAKGEPGANAFGTVSRKSLPFGVVVAGGTPAAPIPSYYSGTVECGTGQVAVGGGVDVDSDQLWVTRSYPTAAGTGWTASVGHNDTTRPHFFTVVVLCAAGTVG